MVSSKPPIGELVLVHREFLLRYLRAHGAGDQAEDLVQEIWLKAQRSKITQDVSRGYLMRMAHTAIIDHARSARQRNQRDHRWQTEGLVRDNVDPTPDAERALIARERLRKVEAVLRTLDPRTERILRRHRVDDMPQKQIAIEENLSLSSIEKHLQTAYRALAMTERRADDGRERAQ